MLAGMLLLAVLTGALAALAALIAGAPAPVVALAYAVGGNMGLLAGVAVQVTRDDRDAT